MKKPKILILATGGTIAGLKNAKDSSYTPGVLSIDEIIKDLPEFNAHIIIEQFININSADMTNSIQLNLAKRVKEILASDIDGVVITHGTDTLEESAYFLSLTLPKNKPIIFTGAMRPFNALSQDGLKNLYNAIILASDKSAKGVLITLNDRILSAREATKIHTLNLDAFSSPNSSDIGYIIGTESYFYHTLNATPFDIDNITKLPIVDILYTYTSDRSAIAAKALINSGTQALVIAGSGAGSVHKAHKEVLKEFLKQGIFIAISSRVGAGSVMLSKQDLKDGFISANNLNPQKARILLELALSKTRNLKQIREYFLKF